MTFVALSQNEIITSLEHEIDVTEICAPRSHSLMISFNKLPLCPFEVSAILVLAQEISILGENYTVYCPSVKGNLTQPATT